jgi:hypothetical protein
MDSLKRLLVLVVCSSLVSALAIVTQASGRVQTQGSLAISRRAALNSQGVQTLPESVFAGGETKAVSRDQAGGSDDAAKAAEAQKAQARLQKIQQLTFDRRPSEILKAWSHPESEPEKKPEEPPEPAPGEAKPPEPDPFDAELKAFQRDVTLGKWDAVKAFLAKLPRAEARAAYSQLLNSLPNPMMQQAIMMPQMSGRAAMMMTRQMQMQMQMQMNPQFMETNTFSCDDVIGLAAACPHKRTEEVLSGLSRILQMALTSGHSIDDCVAKLRAEAAKPAEQAALNRREAAKLLVGAGYAVEAGAFLPSAEEAQTANDREALNLLAKHHLARYDKDKKTESLEQAWMVTQAVLAAGEVDPEQKAEALKRCVELAPKVKADLGQAWLDESFTRRPERGMEVLATIGSATAQGMQTYPMDAPFRRKLFELEKTAVEALLKASPERANQWRETLELLAIGWMSEADFSRQWDTSTSLGPMMQRDLYGNIYYMGYDYQTQMMMQQQQNMPAPIPVGEILELRPQDEWMNHVGESLKPRYATLCAQLYLKVGEEQRAFPYIERLAGTHGDAAKALVEEFLRVWTQNHDPNTAQNRRSSYIYFFGFEQRAESIPLTRSKQERNLKELAGWVERLRKLPVGNLDDKLLSQAFTACHSVAEVYRIEAIESVFGSLDALKPETLAALIQQMRGNLAGVWRQPAVQEKNKTRRREKDIREEILRGYEVARAVVDKALEKNVDNWSLVQARAALLLDEANFRQEIEPGPDFLPKRRGSLAEFQRAAELYAKGLSKLAEDVETSEPYESWMYASLGASDLGSIQEKHQADPRQPPLIKAAIDALPGEAAERHRKKFANNLFTRMSSLNPAVKQKYVEAGLTIVGDHPHAREISRLHDYYKDLVTEIKLEARVDGSDVVGHGEPFGVFVNLLHTRDIERESGGFGKYLQNQNSGSMFYYNYGRPLENYRDKFEEAARAALDEHFEVKSITFQSEDVNSRATEEYGWRMTPYAYMLLKAKSPKVDRLPPVRLDLDFLDTSGYVILPIESPVVPIDASKELVAARPFEKLKITQTLDERQATEGRLIVEVKATALGLVPRLEEILDVSQPGFEVAETEDQGLLLARFDPDGPGNNIVSERNWLVRLRPVAQSSTAQNPPDLFRFASAKVDADEMVYQRYVDADLVPVERELRLSERYERPSTSWLWWLAGIVAALAALLAAYWLLRPRARSEKRGRFAVPESITPFSVLGLLRSIHENNGLAEPTRRELASSIEQLERHYFDAPGASEPDLRSIAETWVRRAS